MSNSTTLEACASSHDARKITLLLVDPQDIQSEAEIEELEQIQFLEALAIDLDFYYRSSEY
jgi:hypothetical protein